MVAFEVRLCNSGKRTAGLGAGLTVAANTLATVPATTGTDRIDTRDPLPRGSPAHLAGVGERPYAVVPGPMLRAGRVRRSCTYSPGAPAISAASAITPRYRADGSPPSQASST